MSSPRKKHDAKDAVAANVSASPATPAGKAQPTLTAPQQRAAVERIHESIALRSGAGCGKTYVLARRFTELLLASKNENPLSRFVALTFTDKAALEMKDRVRRMLADFAAGATGANRIRLLEWLEEAADARISTIHSFCTGLLRAHAIEAGVDPAFTVCADDLMAGRMVVEAADQALLAAVESQDAGAAALLNLMSYDQAVEHIRSLIQVRTSVELATYVDSEAIVARWRQNLQTQRQSAWQKLRGDAQVRQLLETIEAFACGNPSDPLLPLRDELAGSVRRLLGGVEPTAADFAQIADIRPGGSGSKKAWLSPKEVRDRMKELQGCIAPYGLFAGDLGAADERSAQTLGTLARLAMAADELYSKSKADAGMLDFDDLLVATSRLLAENKAVRQELASQIDQLLIDECQDTDKFQLDLLGMLVQGARDEGGSGGTLFIVGDAKQSIYRFRGAQVEVFEALCRQIGAGHQEHLDESFRTHQAGVDFVNALFGPLMGTDYQPTSARRKDAPPAPSVEIILAGDEEGLESAEQAGAAQAAVTAQRIGEMLDGQERRVWDGDAKQWRPVRPGDIAILFARMTNSLEYERELAARNIPYYVVAGTGFFRQQEVLDVLNALRVIDNPFNDVALVGALRSSLFGLDDNALMHIASQLEPPYFRPLLSRGAALAGLSESGRRIVTFAMRLLGGLHESKDAIGIAAIVERLLAATGYEATLLAQPQGKRMLGNVRLLLEQARHAATSFISLSEFITQMNELVLDESRYEQAAVAGESQDVVRLMTIHKAKGLEFPVVFVPDLNAARRGVTKSLLHRSDWGLTFNLSLEDEEENGDDGELSSAPLSHQIAKSLEDCDQQREDIRKYYVALTRHEDHLVLVGADWRSQEGHFRSGDCFLGKLDGVLGLTEALEAAKESGGNASEGLAIPYGHGKYRMLLRQMIAQDASRGPREKSVGGEILASATSAQGIVEKMQAAAGTGTPPLGLLGPVRADVGRLEVAVTALGDFEKCPMLFHWRYELGVPQKYLLPGPKPKAKAGTAEATTVSDAAASGAAHLDAATMGTIFHRCMELLDFTSPTRGDSKAASLVQRALAEMGLEGQADASGLAVELEAMIATLSQRPLYGQMRGARRTERELSFLLDWPGLTLRGQIDLIFEDQGGRWHVVDYKSDRVAGDGLAEHGRRYEMQMLLYAAAATQHLGGMPSEATLYFLRAGREHIIPITPDALERAKGRACGLAREIATARRSGRFERRQSEFCPHCLYQGLCLLQRD